MRFHAAAILAISLSIVVSSSFGQEGQVKKSSKNKTSSPSFKKDIFPIIKKNCMPCHAEENFNPSELSMDDYDKLQAGGKNGTAWVVGKPDESLIVKKLGNEPPFGDRMPLNSKRKITEGKAKWLTDDEVKTIVTWIDGGAKNN